MSFIGIHNHTDMGSNLRLRDSTNKIEDLIRRAFSLGHSGVCITDHEAITAHLNALKFYESKKDMAAWKGFKLGLGNEIYLCDESCTQENIGHNEYPHFILIATDELGHKGIRELSTNSWVNNSFMHVMYRVPTYYSDLLSLMDTYKGHIIGSTACIGSIVGKRLLQYKNTNNEDIYNKVVGWVCNMNEIFGNGYFFLELQPSHNPDQIFVNEKLIEISKNTGIPYLISTDAHYLSKEDRTIHKAFLTSQDGDRETDDFYASTYVMSEEEIHEYMDPHLGFDVVKKGIENTMLVWDKLEYYKLTKDLEIPYLPLNKNEPDENLYNKYKDKIELLQLFKESPHDCDRHLAREILNKIEKDPHYRTDEAFYKINECLSYIEESSKTMNVRWSAYLLQVSDYVDIAWKSGSLVGAGRGSGVGFCLNNILDITQINPLRETTATFPWRLT